MCGIAGFIEISNTYDTTIVAKNMGNSLAPRGPDSDGVWQDNNLGVCLIHRRLAIQDLSAAGHQPMVSRSERFIIVFNGEIYNFKRIIAQLEAKLGPVIWRGHSDTEVILLAVETYGIETTLTLLEGMFALALWDREQQCLYLARDRMGEKPLYYGYANGVFLFASELKAISQHPKFKPEIERDALGQLLLHNCIPSPLSIYQGVYKLAPGQYIVLTYQEYRQLTMPQPKAYWCLAEHLAASFQGSANDAINKLEQLLTNVVAEQMVADVPIGCFLSGGIDSATVAALMQQHSSSPIKTFSIGFDQAEYNEAVYAKAVAKHLGTDHSELYLSDKMALSVIPKLGTIYDEPFSDSSQIPTFLVSQLAKTKVKVALSGDGGDELFAGYMRYLYADRIFTNSTKFPKWLKNWLLKILRLGKLRHLEQLSQWLNIPLTNLSDKVYKLESLLAAENFNAFYVAVTGHWLNYNEVVTGTTRRNSLWDKGISLAELQNDKVVWMQYLDCLGYLPDDILVKVDRAAMANSLETRVPFLNHKIVEFAFSLPMEYKIRAESSKWVLRQVLFKYVPKSLIERPKQGCAIPLNNWLRGELKEWAYDLLNPAKLNAQGFFNSNIITDKLARHMSGVENNASQLWDVLMFQQWLYANKA